MVSLVILAAVVIGIVVAVGKRGPKGGASDLDVSGKGSSAASLDSERAFLHILSFVGFIGALYALTNLIALIFTAVSLRSSTVLSGTDVRTRVSYYLAALIVGAPLWYGCWVRLQRQISETPEKRPSFERRFFLAAVFASTAVMALFGLQMALSALLSLPGSRDPQLQIRDLIVGSTQFLIWGGACLAYADFRRRQSDGSVVDEPHDLARYILTGFGLAFATTGLWKGIQELVSDLTSRGGSVMLGGDQHSIWIAWAPIVALIVAGGGVWVASMQYDMSMGGKRTWRITYLYLVLAFAVPAALAGGIDTLYESLRRIFGYHWTGSPLLFLRDSLPPLLLGGVFWAYHWALMRRQSAIEGVPTSTIPWPRRSGIALLSLVGLAITAPAFTYLLWLALDALRVTGNTVSGGDWWRDGASFAIAAGLIGGAAWSGSWTILQSAVAIDPQHEGGAPERRRVIGLIVVVSALIATGFFVAVLWETFQIILNVNGSSTTVDWILKDASAVLVAGLVGTYYGHIFRTERPLQKSQAAPLRVAALVYPGGEEALAQLAEATGLQIVVTGYVGREGMKPNVGLDVLSQQLSELQINRSGDTVLLIVGPEGGTLYSYSKEKPYTDLLQGSVDEERQGRREPHINPEGLSLG